MKNKRSFTLSGYGRYSATFLIVFFLSIPFIQWFHQHESHAREHELTVTAKCQICEDLWHFQSSPGLPVAPMALATPSLIVVKMDTSIQERMYPFSLQNSPNKGPPAIS